MDPNCRGCLLLHQTPWRVSWGMHRHCQGRTRLQGRAAEQAQRMKLPGSCVQQTLAEEQPQTGRTVAARRSAGEGA